MPDRVVELELNLDLSGFILLEHITAFRGAQEMWRHWARLQQFSISLDD